MLGVASPEWHKAIRFGVNKMRGSPRITSYMRRAVASVTASGQRFGFVASRRNPCCVRRQNEHPSLTMPRTSHWRPRDGRASRRPVPATR